MDRLDNHIVVTYPLLCGDSHIAEVFGSNVWQFGPFETSKCREVVSVLFPTLPVISLPMQVRELDDEALLILVNARVVREMSIAA